MQDSLVLGELEDEIQKLRQELKSVSRAAKGIPADDSNSLRSPELSRPPVNDSDSLPNEDTQPIISQSFTPTQGEKQDRTTDISRSGRLLNIEQPTPSAPALSVPPVVQDNGRTGHERQSSEAEPDIDYMHYQHLNAPVTAVQSMGSTSPDSEKVLHSAGLDDGSIHYGQTSQALTEALTPPSAETSDVVLDIFEDESQARLLFASYFEGGNPYLPMFDPIVDTFDSIRARSPFCLIAILFIALKQKSGIVHKVTTDLQKTVREACLQEARRQVCDSIFESPTLESVQAMTLLAANAEKSWFAIGHAHEMALELGLDSALDELLSAGSLTTDRAHFHSGSRRARTWLILYHIERELAVGTARKPRIRQLDTASLRHYLDLPVSYPSDMRFVATIEIVQLRADIQRQIETTTSLPAISESAPREFEQKAQEWFQYWDGRFKGILTPLYEIRRTLWLCRPYHCVEASF
ncbi:C6 transcription factor [Fonsecaea pedrosoi]|nr:C6 transcription factor [Fonsecaea pedrosoi]